MDSPQPPPQIQPDDPLLLAWLRDRDVPCPLCQYNLRNLPAPRCPECGHALRLSVSLAEPFLAAWILLAGAACASGGIGLLFLALVIHLGWPDGSNDGASISIIIFFAMIPVAAMTLCYRRRLLRLPGTSQWILAALTLAIFLFAGALMVACLK